MDLVDWVTVWPTPSASNPNESETLESWQARRDRELAKGRNGNGFGMPLGVAVRLWPTPAAQNIKGPGTNQHSGPNLPQAVQRWATPKSSDGDGRGSAKGDRGIRRNLVDQVSSALNPEWVEMLMGLPQGWTAIAGPLRPARTSTRGSRRARSAKASPTEASA